MGQYRIRKARPGEQPGYYTKQQLAMKKFAAGGEQADINLELLIPQLKNEYVAAIINDPDPESVDIRPLMSKSVAQLQQYGIDESAINSIINAAGKQALQSVANVLNKDIDTDEDEENNTAVGNELATDQTEIEEDWNSSNDYGYYDDSNASDDGEDDQLINEMIMSGNAVQDTPEAQMGMTTGQPYFSSMLDTEALLNDPEGYEAFINTMKYGGYSGKRKFIKETLNRLAKANDGMEQGKESGSASLRGTADDIQGRTLTSKDTFVPAVKQTAQNAANKKFAEEQYNSMMNDEFQFGGANRRLRRANRAMFGVPLIPPGVSADYKFGLLGGLRSANVSWDPRMMQGMFGFGSVMPGMMQSYSGGWYSPTYKIKGTRVKSASETPAAIVAKTENKEALDKVSKDTPNSTATSSENVQGQVNADVAKNTGIDANNPNAGSSPGTANAELNSSTSGDGTSNNQRDNVNQPKLNKDAWGRPEGDEWFGFDPDKNKAEKGKFKKDKWGRPEYDQWYGFNKSSGKYTLGDKAGKTPKQVMEEWKKNNQGQMRQMMIESQPYLYNPDGTMKSQASSAHDELIQDIVFGVPKMGLKAIRGAYGLYKTLKNVRPKTEAEKSATRFEKHKNQAFPNNGRMNTKRSSVWPDQGPYGPGLQIGGAVNPELYKYIYGGDDIDDADMDFTYSKDVSDPYFQDGGLYEFDGENDSQVTSGNTTKPGAWKDLNEADYKTKLEEEKKKWQAEFAKNQNPQQGQQQYYNQQQYYPGAFGSAGAGQPMWGRPNFGGYPTSGRLGQFGNLYGAVTNDFTWYSPYSKQGSGKMAVDPNMAFAASMGNIQKSGMIPTGISYSKQRKQDGNWFERNLGFNKDRITTINYAKPGQQGSNDLDNNGIPDNIQSNALDPNLVKQQGQPSGVNQPAGTGSNQPQGSSIYSNTEGLSNKAQRQIRRGERRTAREVGRGEAMMANESTGLNADLFNKGVEMGAIKTGCFGPNCNQSSSNQPQTYRPKPNIGSGMFNVSEGIEGPPVNPNIPTNKPMYNPGRNTGSGMYNVSGEFGYGGYIPPFAFEDGGYMPEFQIAGEINNQTTPMGNSVPSWITDPVGTAVKDSKQNMLDNCTDEEKQNPASPCYQKDTEQLSFKEEKAKTIHWDRVGNSLKTGARFATDVANELSAINNVRNPGMQKMIYDNMTPQQRKYTGKWEENTGTQNKMGFEGVVKKGGTTGFKENGEYQLTMDEIRAILKAGGKVEFL